MKKNILLVLVLSVFLFGCSRNNFKSGKNISQATGWKINSGEGGFQLENKYKGQQNAPGMIFVQGGTFVKGNAKDNVMHDWNNTPTQQFVRSFFMDETEVTNAMYGEYLFWLKKVFGKDPVLKEIYLSALPDTLVWRNPLGFNEDMVNNYLRHPAFQNHPVVGVSWNQASNFAKWRTQRVNERLLSEKGFLNSDSITNPNSNLIFDTKSYLLDPKNAFEGKIQDIIGDNSVEENDTVFASIEKGILLPAYRLPTETEWEYAALGLEELRNANLYRGKKKFPWSGEYTRSQRKKNLGDQLANFKLGKGDYGGIAGWSETGSGITTSVRSYPPNSYGLYGMAGNVAEWVSDVYRPIIDEEANDFNYYRGNLYKKVIDKNGKVTTMNRETLTQKILNNELDTLPNGRVIFKNLPGELVENSLSVNDLVRVNYTKDDNRSFRDGDSESTRFYSQGENQVSNMYNSPTDDQQNASELRLSMISDDTRVFKGGSWVDRSYYLDPAQRRFYPEFMATNFIGFRCAMSYLGESRNVTKPNKR